MRLLALAVILIVALAIGIIATKQNARQRLTLIQASCPRLENPCLRVDCHRPKKGIIA